MDSYQADLAQLARDPSFKALEADQPYIVKAILEAETLRFAEQVEVV